VFFSSSTINKPGKFPAITLALSIELFSVR
jgi:hypothetical protein